ncbi:MAG: hypothetical protein KME46_33970 [Brasilonema angustatum HA4187-MV1]|nr:hypothetical protein [Brasilonema angustatum HA4187-MV1]
MQKLDKSNYITIELYKNYNPPGGIEASTSLYSLIQQRDLTSCLEVLERLGFAEERAIHAITGLQILGGVA